MDIQIKEVLDAAHITMMAAVGAGSLVVAFRDKEGFNKKAAALGVASLLLAGTSVVAVHHHRETGCKILALSCPNP